MCETYKESKPYFQSDFFLCINFRIFLVVSLHCILHHYFSFCGEGDEAESRKLYKETTSNSGEMQGHAQLYGREPNPMVEEKNDKG